MSPLRMFLSGLVAVLALCMVFFFRQRPGTDRELEERARYVLHAEGMTWAKVSADGGDLHLSGNAPTIETGAKAAYMLAQLQGVDTVQNELVLPPTPPKVFTSLKRGGPEDASGGGEREEAAGRIGALSICQAETKTLLSSGKIAFEPATATLSTGSRSLLDDLISIMEKCPEASILIEGHTDDTGSDASNMDLSRLRAASVADHLRSYGIAAGRLSATGYGESRPIADNGTEAGRAENRRVEILVMEGSPGTD